jgi:hypothetical protein
MPKPSTRTGAALADRSSAGIDVTVASRRSPR